MPKESILAFAFLNLDFSAGRGCSFTFFSTVGLSFKGEAPIADAGTSNTAKGGQARARFTDTN